MATFDQAGKLLQVFQGIDTEPMQQILGSGVLTIIRDRPELVQQFINVARGRAEIHPIEHVIDFSIPCKLPFVGAEFVSPVKSGFGKLELRDGDLYLDGKKIERTLSEKQQSSGVIRGYELRIEREKLGGNISAKILDYLEEHPELWPESWKKDAGGNTINIYFWDDIFHYPADDNLYVRYGYWSGDRVKSSYDWLDSSWRRRHYAASVAS